MTSSPGRSKEDYNEEKWIEANWLCSEERNEKDNKDEEEFFAFDIFADPDPYDTFLFTFGEGINLKLKGIKQENGQTLNSTGLTLWRASPKLCEYMVSNAILVKGEKVLEVSKRFRIGKYDPQALIYCISR